MMLLQRNRKVDLFCIFHNSMLIISAIVRFDARDALIIVYTA